MDLQFLKTFFQWANMKRRKWVRAIFWGVFTLVKNECKAC